MDVYPDFNWTFKEQKPSGYWDDPKNRLDFVKQLEQKLNIKQLEEWYAVTIKTVLENGGRGWLER
jgi:hypothetical protein